MHRPQHQRSLALIARQVNDSIIQQRTSDGYINATELCKAAGRRWHNYLRDENSGHFLRALAAKTRISVMDLNQEVRGENGTSSTWVHPKVAIHLAQWLSADFAVQVSEWVYDWMAEGRRPAGPQSLPYHLERYMLNHAAVPHTHFSIFQEIVIGLIGPMEHYGYQLPAELVPDISQGKMFAKFAREELGIETDTLPTYRHRYPDGRVVDAKMYPIEHLAAFRRHFNEVWLPGRAKDYFQERHPDALPYLDRLPQLSGPTASVGVMLPKAKKKRAA
jgi:hypothetical protein